MNCSKTDMLELVELLVLCPLRLYSYESFGRSQNVHTVNGVKISNGDIWVYCARFDFSLKFVLICNIDIRIINSLPWPKYSNNTCLINFIASQQDIRYEGYISIHNRYIDTGIVYDFLINCDTWYTTLSGWCQ